MSEQNANISKQNTTDKTDTNIIRMVDNAMRVLDSLRTSPSPQGVNEIAKNCKLNPSTAFRVLKTLEMEGWVFQLHDDRYIPGEKISFATPRDNFYLALQEVAAIIMETYAKKYNHPMNLMVRDDKFCVILQQARTENIIDYITPKYSRLPFYACASGKILLSELPVNIVDDIIQQTDIKPLTPHTICNPDDYWKELRKTAKRGYAFDNHESSLLGSAIAVPIRDNLGRIIASLSFCGFIGIKKPEEMLQYLPTLNEASSIISHSFYKSWRK